MVQPASQPERKAYQILVVDDDGPVREMLARVFAEEGYSVWPAAHGEDAIKIAAATQIDLVLLDLGLPGKGGWDAFEELTLRDPLLAVIVITAKPNQLEVAQAAGAGALFEKPLDFPALLRTAAELIAEPPAVRVARMVGFNKKYL